MFVEEKSKGEVPDFKLGTLRLSTAIRIGAQKRPQCVGQWFAAGRSCALGAAWEGTFGHTRLDRQAPGDVLAEKFGFPGKRMIEIARKNDGGWSREQIADWLEGQGY